MSVDNTYLLARINAIQRAIELLVVSVDSVINTQGRLSSVTNGLYGEIEMLKSNYLSVILNLTPGSCSSRSVDVFLSKFPEGFRKHPKVKEVLTDILSNFKPSEVNFIVRVLDSDHIEISKVVSGETLRITKSLAGLLSEQQLVTLYNKLFDINPRERFTELHNTFKMFTSNIDYMLTTEQMLLGVGKGLKHNYSIDNGNSVIMFNLNDSTVKTIKVSDLTRNGYFTNTDPFWTYVDLLDDIELFSNRVDNILSLIVGETET